MKNHDKVTLRNVIRKARSSLSTQEVAAYSEDIATALLRLPFYLETQHIGCYLAVQNEVDLSPFIQHVWQTPKKIYVPVLTEHHQMDFYQYRPSTTLIKNRYGIGEPDPCIQDKIHPSDLDLLLIPLVAFDEKKNRLGQGLGLYDRYLAQYQQTNQKPITVGIAYELQKTDYVPVDAWDITLDLIVSEKRIYGS